MQSVWFCLVLYSAVSLVLVGTVSCSQFGPGWYCLVQLVWFWLVLSGAVSLVLVGTVWCSLVGLVDCLVLPVAVCLVWFDLLGTAWCSLFGLFGLAWYCLVQSGWSVWSGLTCLVLPVAVWLVCLVWFDLLGTACCSLFGLI